MTKVSQEIKTIKNSLEWVDTQVKLGKLDFLYGHLQKQKLMERYFLLTQQESNIERSIQYKKKEKLVAKKIQISKELTMA